MKYIMQGKYIVVSTIPFTRNMGARLEGGEKFQKDEFLESESSKKLTKIWAEYDEWVKNQK